MKTTKFDAFSVKGYLTEGMIHVSCQTGAHWQHGLQQSQQCWPRFSTNNPRLRGFRQNDGVLTELKILVDSKEVA